MDIQTVNNILKQKDRPAVKQAPVADNKKIDTASLKARIAELRKSVEAAYNKAHELKAWKQMAPLHSLLKTLTELGITLNKISK